MTGMLVNLCSPSMKRYKIKLSGRAYSGIEVIVHVTHARWNMINDVVAVLRFCVDTLYGVVYYDYLDIGRVYIHLKYVT